jgi:hypothetical protein
MKYTTFLCLIGAVSLAQANKMESAVARRTPVKDVTFLEESSSSSSDSSKSSGSSSSDSDSDKKKAKKEKSLVQLQWTEPWGPGEDGIIDALTPPLAACKERLWEDPRELSWQMDMFSRTCDRKYYDNSVFIAKEIEADLPKVNAWELMDKAFEFSRIRRYDFVNDNMDMLEHF